MSDAVASEHIAVSDGVDAEALASMKENTGDYHDESLRNVNTYIDSQHDGLSAAHTEYLVKRHGTAELDPLPGFGDADPYNWPKWKVWLTD